MPITNLNNAHLTEAQQTEIKNALSTLENALSSLNVTLTAAERQQYGSVNEQHKLLINKVRDYRRESQNLSVPELDWEEFEKDYNSRQFLESILNRLGALEERLKNAKILHDYDNYQSALDDYAYTSYRAGSQAAGYETKMNELKQFFSTKRRSDGTFPPQAEPLK